MELPLLLWSWWSRPKIKGKRQQLFYALTIAKEVTGSQRNLQGLLGDAQNGYDTSSAISPTGLYIFKWG